MLNATVSLFYRDLQIACSPCRIHIRDLEGTRRNVGLVNLIPILTDNDLRIGTRDTADNGCIPLEGVGLHIIIGGQLRTAERHAVEDISGRSAIAKGHLRF